MKPSVVLFGASMALRARGHAKGMNRRDDGALCLMGAIRLARTGSPYGTGSDIRDLQERIGDIVGTTSIVMWNDADDREENEVIAALDAAAVVALQEEGIEPEDVL